MLADDCSITKTIAYLQDRYSYALSTLAGMTFGHYQLFKFSLASEAVLPDNRIVLAPLPFPPCVLEQCLPLGHCPIVWTGP